ncbi:MAG: TOMM precursor leader peptide-binding protein, partial [Ktedonobacteraceae bacterium]
MVGQSTRLQWRADTYSIPMSDGVYLRGNNSRLILKGKSLYHLLERLAPTLNGEVTLEQITEGLDADKKRMVMNLLEKLADHHFLRDRSQDQLHGLDLAELETYAPNLTFIESFQTSAAYRFERFRNQRLLLIGSGPGCASLLHTSLQGGVKQVNVLLTPGDEIGLYSPRDLLASFAGTIPDEHVQCIDTPAWENEAEVRATIRAYDAVLHIAEQPALARARLLNRVCIEEQKTFIQAVIIDERAWIGPLVCPETGNCWECAWRRLQANLTDLTESMARYEFHTQPPTSASQPLTMAEATLVANQLLFTLFQHVTQVSATETAGRLSALDLATLQSESHAFQPHPHCRVSQHPV